MGIDTTIIPVNANAIKADILATVSSDINLLGEVRTFTLSIAGSLTKAQLQAKGWAICDGTTPASQGISDATITTTPDLRERFLRHSADETTGGTGGSLTHNHQWTGSAGGAGNSFTWASNGSSSQSMVHFAADGGATNVLKSQTSGTQYYTKNTDISPPYYDICYFIKVKV